MKILNLIIYYLKLFFQILSNSFCLFCSKKTESEIVCSNCEKLKEYINKTNYCYKCGSVITHQSKCNFCVDFYNFKYIRTIVKYDSVIRPIIFGLKYQRKLECANYIAEDILNNFPIEYNKIKFDYITCIPTHFFRLYFRGYNHTEYLAKYLGNKLNINFVNIVKRSRYVKSQTHIKHHKRYENIKNSFELINLIDLKNKNILIIEDVITTGSTLKEYLKILNKTKANIYVLIYADARHVQN